MRVLLRTQVIHNGQKNEPLNMRNGIRQGWPAISLAVSGCPLLGDQDSLCRGAWYLVVLHDILERL